MKTCTWIEEPQVEDIAWRTGCAQLFQFTADGPKQNGFAFCPYCGGRLDLAKRAEDQLALPIG